MKLFVKLFMLASLTVGGSTAWAAAEPAAQTPEQKVEQAHKFAIETKNMLTKQQSAKMKRELLKRYLDDVKNLENACKAIPCSPDAPADKAEFCKKHCKLDKKGHPAPLDAPAVGASAAAAGA